MPTIAFADRAALRTDCGELFARHVCWDRLWRDDGASLPGKLHPHIAYLMRASSVVDRWSFKLFLGRTD